MCGIMAYSSYNPNKSHAECARRIALELETRGTHSFGLSFVSDGKIETVKSRRMLPLSAFEEAVASGGFIFHNRYSTSGDFSDMMNNQPIDVGSVSIAVNGVTSMLRKAEYEAKFGVKCASENDAEILARMIEQGKSVKDIICDGSVGSCAIAALFRDGKIVIGRNKYRPLRIATYNGAVFAASTSAALFSGLCGNSGEPVKIGEEVNLSQYGI